MVPFWFKGSLCPCWKQNMQICEQAVCIHVCLPCKTLEKCGVTSQNFLLSQWFFFLRLNDSDHVVCFFIYFLFSDSWALGWHFIVNPGFCSCIAMVGLQPIIFCAKLGWFIPHAYLLLISIEFYLPTHLSYRFIVSFCSSSVSLHPHYPK